MNGRKQVSFRPWFPTPTAGDGRIRANNARSGKNQPNARPSAKRKAGCKNCGFPADLAKNVNDGGSFDGDGAGGGFTTHSSDSNVKEQEYRKGGGCPFCFSRNFANERQPRK